MTLTSLHHRRSLRLCGYDYTQAGAYFITICTQNRLFLFGEATNETFHPNPAGKMIATAWGEMPDHYPGMDVDAFIVMPNHIHGVIALLDHSRTTSSTASVGAIPRGCPVIDASGRAQGPAPADGDDCDKTLSLPDIVHRFKSWTTKLYSDAVKQLGWSRFPGRLWQRNYYEHIVRNDDELERIREYIQMNPARWAFDRLNPEWIEVEHFRRGYEKDR